MTKKSIKSENEEFFADLENNIVKDMKMLGLIE